MSAPVRFAMLTTFYPPYHFGGDAIGIERLIDGLLRRGHEVEVIHDVDAYLSLTKGKEPELPPERSGLKVHRLRSGLGMLSPLLTQQAGRPIVNGRKIAAILAAGRFDVINYHNVSLVGGPGLFRYGDAVKLYMAHEHWLVCPSHVLWRKNRELCDKRECIRCQLAFKRPPQLWRMTGFLEREAKRVDAFIAMSEFSRRKHAEFGFPYPMEVLPYFLPDPAAADQVEAPTKRLHERPYVLFVGRLEKIKGLDDVLPLWKTDRGVDLLIAGDGEHGPALRDLAKDLSNVRFLGRVDQATLKTLYRDALALIVPSVCFETFGIILIEAFRQGTPVIARRLGPFPEIVEKARAGELFGSAEELVQALTRLRDDAPYRAALSAAGRAAYLQHWTESAVIPAYLDIARRAALKAGRTDSARKLES